MTLRSAARSDIASLLRWVESPETLMYWSGARFSYPLTRGQLHRHFDRIRREHVHRRAYVGVVEGHAVAYGELVRIKQKLVRFARILVDPSARGEGYGRAFVQLLMPAAGTPNVDLFVFAANKAAQRCYERCGFAVERVLPAAFTDECGTHHDLIKMQTAVSTPLFPAG